MSRNTEPVSFEKVVATKESRDALMVWIDGKSRWIPKSAIHDDSEVYDSDMHNSGKLVAYEWWAEKEGLA